MKSRSLQLADARLRGLVMESKTVRELSGEIWAEVNHFYWKRQIQVPTEELEVFIDITMGVLARHVEKQVKNDDDLPVEPLP